MRQYTIYVTDHSTGESCTLQAGDLEDFFYTCLRGLEGLNRHHGAILEAMDHVVRKEYRPARRKKQAPKSTDGDPTPEVS